MRLYHLTSIEDARLIRKTGKIDSPYGEVYFTSRSNSMHSTVHCGGPVIVSCEAPNKVVHLEDEFPDGEKHYRILSRDMNHVSVITVEER